MADEVQAIQQLEELVKQAKAKSQELDEEYKKFDGLRTELKNKAAGIRKFHSDSEVNGTKLSQLLQESAVIKKDLEETQVKINQTKTEIDQYHQRFVELRQKLDDETDGLEANYEWVKTKKEEVSQKHEEIIKIVGKTEDLQKQMEATKEEIASTKKTSEEFKDSIGEILDLVTTSSLQNAFAKRKDEITSALKFWRWFLMIGLAALAIAVMVIYALQANSNGFHDWSQWYRYLFTAPIIYLIVLSSRNYNLERELLEKYSFKAVLSTSLRAYIQLLKDHFSENQADILDFTKQTLERIYKEPYIDKLSNRKFIFGLRNFFNAKEDLINAQIEEADSLMIDPKK